jgi:hypothetical protein
MHFACYKWGRRYSAQYVNILHASVLRHYPGEVVFHCVTDDAEGLSSDILVHAIPAAARIGNGPKIYTFSDGFLGLGDRDHVVSLDLDVVIVGPMGFLDEGLSRDFVIARHRSPRSISRGHGAVYRVRVGSQRFVWDRFIADPAAAAAQCPGRANVNAFSEQKWLEVCYAGIDLHHFPAEKVISFRRDCDALSPLYRLGDGAARMGLTTAWFGAARLPCKGEAIVSFSGLTKPADVIARHHLHLRKAPFVKVHWKA